MKTYTNITLSYRFCTFSVFLVCVCFYLRGGFTFLAEAAGFHDPLLFADSVGEPF